ncbi:MAG TPA: F0F1 ATP synthase subunit epsilon [Bacillota bacterium]
MATRIQLEVITPERAVLSEEVDSLILPGVDGLFGVLPNHQAMVATLRVGAVIYRQDGRREKLAISGGFFEFARNRAVILADAAERPGEIDVARAQEAAERARRRLKDRQGKWDHVRARAALERALNRLRVGGAA